MHVGVPRGTTPAAACAQDTRVRCGARASPPAFSWGRGWTCTRGHFVFAALHRILIRLRGL